MARERRRGIVSRLLIDYKIGDKVIINIDRSRHKGAPFWRFQGKVGTVIEKRGRAYCIAIKDGKKIKKVIAKPEHLMPFR